MYLLTEATAASGTSSILLLVFYVVIIGYIKYQEQDLSLIHI